MSRNDTLRAVREQENHMRFFRKRRKSGPHRPFLELRDRLYSRDPDSIERVRAETERLGQEWSAVGELTYAINWIIEDRYKHLGPPEVRAALLSVLDDLPAPVEQV